MRWTFASSRPTLCIFSLSSCKGCFILVLRPWCSPLGSSIFFDECKNGLGRGRQPSPAFCLQRGIVRKGEEIKICVNWDALRIQGMGGRVKQWQIDDGSVKYRVLRKKSKMLDRVRVIGHRAIAMSYTKAMDRTMLPHLSWAPRKESWNSV